MCIIFHVFPVVRHLVVKKKEQKAQKSEADGQRHLWESIWDEEKRTEKIMIGKWPMAFESNRACQREKEF